MPAVVSLIHIKWKNHYQAYYEVVEAHTSTSMEGEYKLVPWFNYTQKDHGEKPKEDPSGILKPEKKKKVYWSTELSSKAAPKNKTRIQSKAWFYFTHKYQAHSKLTSPDKSQVVAIQGVQEQFEKLCKYSPR